MKTGQIRRSILGSALALIFCGAALDAPLHAEEAVSESMPVVKESVAARLAREYRGVGPVEAGSVTFDQLPSKTRKFLRKHCNGRAVVRCDKVFTTGQYNLELADGIRFEFDKKGNVIETVAPEGYSLARPLLRAVVPGKFYHLLIHNGLDQCVDRMEHTADKYRVDVDDPVFSSVLYGKDGVLTLVTSD